MTQSADAQGTETPSIHVSKISPDDPRLKLPQAKVPTLSGRAIGLGIGVVVALLAAAGAYALGVFDSTVDINVSKEQLVDGGIPERTPKVHRRVYDIEDEPKNLRKRPLPSAATTDASTKAQDEGLVAQFDPPPFRPLEAAGSSVGTQSSGRAGRPVPQDRALEQWWSAGMTVAVNTNAGERADSSTTTPGYSQVAGSLGARGAAAEADPNGQFHKNAYMNNRSRDSFSSAHRLQAPVSPYVVQTMTFIKAALETKLNSDLPGLIKGRVTEAVMDSVTLSTVLIPQGSTLMGSYDSHVTWGQLRVLVCWDRLTLPNGKTIPLDCMPAADRQGMAGLSETVDEHWARLIAATAVSTVLSLGAQIASTPGVGGVQPPSVVQQAGASAAQSFNQAGQGIVNRGLNLQPTIEAGIGYPVVVVVRQDLVLEPWVARL